MRTILITKEILCKQYISYYGGSIYTPNIDFLFNHGNVIDNLIMGANHTAMSIPIILTGKYGFELSQVPEVERETVMDVMNEKEQSCSAIMSSMYKGYFSRPETAYLNRATDFHYIDNCEFRSKSGFKPFMDLIEEDESDFLWLHLNHFFHPEACIEQGLFTQAESDKYNDFGLMSQTMLALDKFIGWILDTYQNDRIIFTGDHGEAQGENDHWWYTNYFDECIVNLPLVDYHKSYIPLTGPANSSFTTSSRNVKNIILNRPVRNDPMFISESRWPEQTDRKLMLLKDGWKYIYNHSTMSEKLYYMKLNESFNFMKTYDNDSYYDPYKMHLFKYRHLVNFEDWDYAKRITDEFRKAKNAWVEQDFETFNSYLTSEAG